jgi:hypothetical protein
VNPQPVVAGAVERQDGKFSVQVVHHAADHEVAGCGVRGDLHDLVPSTAVGCGLGLMEGDRDVDVTGVDAGHDDGDAVSDLHKSVVSAVQVGAGRAVLVTDVELVVLHRDAALAPFGLVAHLAVLGRTVDAYLIHTRNLSFSMVVPQIDAAQGRTAVLVLRPVAQV